MDYHDRSTGFLMRLPGVVQWRGPEQEGTWVVGCSSACEIPLATLGEMFLRGILRPAKPAL